MPTSVNARATDRPTPTTEKPNTIDASHKSSRNSLVTKFRMVWHPALVNDKGTITINGCSNYRCNYAVVLEAIADGRVHPPVLYVFDSWAGRIGGDLRIVRLSPEPSDLPNRRSLANSASGGGCAG